MHDRLAGVLVENDEGYSFSYLNEYLASANPEATDFTMLVVIFSNFLLRTK